MAAGAMRNGVLLHPCVEGRISIARGVEDGAPLRLVGERRRGKIGFDAADFLRRELQRAIADALPLLLDLAANLFDARLMDEDLDARLELVVAAAEQVVDSENRLQIG